MPRKQTKKTLKKIEKAVNQLLMHEQSGKRLPLPEERGDVTHIRHPNMKHAMCGVSLATVYMWTKRPERSNCRRCVYHWNEFAAWEESVPLAVPESYREATKKG